MFVKVEISDLFATSSISLSQGFVQLIFDPRRPKEIEKDFDLYDKSSLSPLGLGLTE